MSKKIMEVNCTIIRGGTSKGVFLLENDLPKAGKLRDKVVLRLFGSPDPRQIGGLGGADPLTSKVAIVGPADNPEVDVVFTYGMVSIDKPKVFWQGNCGNISAGVGPFAIENSLVKAIGPLTKVKIWNKNTQTLLIAEVPVKNNKYDSFGNFAIDGVPGSGGKISLDYSKTAGSTLGKLLPTGNVIDKITIEGIGKIEISIVDIGNPELFVRAEDLGLTGIETPSEIDSNAELLVKLERIRGYVAKMVGLVSSIESSVEESANIPHLVIVSPPKTYLAYTGKKVSKEQINFTSRVMFMQKLHKAYPGTGAICSSVAAMIPGTIPNQCCNKLSDNKEITIGHPSGSISTEVEVEKTETGYNIKRAALGRTARFIMKGNAYVYL